MQTTNNRTGIFILLTALFLAGCGEPKPQLDEPSDLSTMAVIPLPATMTATGGGFFLDSETRIYTIHDDEEVQAIAQTLQQALSGHVNAEPEIVLTTNSEEMGIVLELTGTENEGAEGYTMKISEDQLLISAGNPAGLFYAVQTLRQLIIADEKYTYVPTGEIRDNPEYEYRGSMLDVARHFFTTEEVKKLIDYMSFYKYNYLHLHLADDQGWRIEIKSWPKLTEIGGSTEVGGGPGGFYTQEEYKDLVAYASERYVTIVPEIDMPGHTNAALASYPELNCDGKARELYTGTEVGFSTLCTDKEITYEFIDDVVGEIVEMTPGPYFHIGGDESHVTPMEDYIPFVNRVQEIVRDHGKISIGWDEIANGTLLEGNIAQFWADQENAGKAIEQGARLLMSPAYKAYLDMQYDTASQFGLHWAAYIPVDSAYIWSADKLAPEIRRENILGIEAPLWSETISDLDEAEYLLFPRLPGYAEISWTPAEKRSWEDYKQRLSEHGKIWDDLDIDYYRSPRVEWPEKIKL